MYPVSAFVGKVTEVKSVTDDEFVSRQQHFEVAHVQFSLEVSSLCWIALKRDHSGWRPLGNLALPVGQGNDGEVGAGIQGSCRSVAVAG